MPGTKITDGDRKRIDSKFICFICHFLLFEPVQTICGHLMCLSCFETLLGNSTPRCPEDGEELSKKKAFSDAFIKRELNGLEIHCANPECTWNSRYDKLESHSQVCEYAIIKCVHSQCRNKFKRSHLGEHLKKECEYRSASNGSQYCRKDVAFASMKEHVATSCEAAPVTVKFTDLESQRGPSAQRSIPSCNGILSWKIDDYQRKRQDAINGVKTALYSPHFYSALNGYKLCAKIYMNGDGFGKGSHLSLFFVVMKGKYDSRQSWPFQKKITMMLLDQGECDLRHLRDHRVHTFQSDPQGVSFQRPEFEMNIGCGFPCFMPIDHMNHRQYIKDDAIIIRIIVD